MQSEQILQVAVIAFVIYLLKIGGLSAIMLALSRLWKRFAKKKDE